MNIRWICDSSVVSLKPAGKFGFLEPTDILEQLGSRDFVSALVDRKRLQTSRLNRDPAQILPKIFSIEKQILYFPIKFNQKMQLGFEVGIIRISSASIKTH